MSAPDKSQTNIAKKRSPMFFASPHKASQILVSSGFATLKMQAPARAAASA
jgi:hypothetical protein